jgi:hypothetical protein
MLLLLIVTGTRFESSLRGVSGSSTINASLDAPLLTVPFTTVFDAVRTSRDGGALPPKLTQPQMLNAIIVARIACPIFFMVNSVSG